MQGWERDDRLSLERNQVEKRSAEYKERLARGPYVVRRSDLSPEKELVQNHETPPQAAYSGGVSGLLRLGRERDRLGLISRLWPAQAKVFRDTDEIKEMYQMTPYGCRRDA